MNLSIERWEQIDALFDAALDQPPAERDAFLRARCGDDAELYQSVKELLEASDNPNAFLEQPLRRCTTALWNALSGEGADEKPTTPSAEDTRIGPYRLVEELGRGGSGVVYRAERTDGAFEQTVAIKLLARATDREAVRQRFHHEQQMLAALRHPHIAHLYDGGLTDDGQPYFVMEYVEGQPLHAYCDTHQLSVAERIDLFTTIVEAVHFAHQNLVVHRDLKPSNILVADDGTVKLLDFGIAKMVDDDAPGLTRTGERWMTPEYAAPEQIKGHAITTATDIYQLGVLLYELLTGSRPHGEGTTSIFEIQRAICEDPPTRPSSAIARAATTKRETADSNAIHTARSADPDALRRTLSGDLDAIILKALRKDPEARYRSAEALADDLARYQKGLPVSARRGTWTYRSQRFIQRHRWSVTAATAFMLLIIGFTALYTTRVTQERNRAQREAEKSAAATNFMISLFEQSSPFVEPSDTITVRSLLPRGVEYIDALDEQPAVQAQLLAAMGRVYQNLGQYDQSTTLLKRALDRNESVHGADHASTAETMADLAWTLRDQGDYERADSLLERALAIRTAQGLTGDAPTADILNDRGIIAFEQSRYSDAKDFHRRALDIRTRIHPEGHPSVGYSYYNLASVLHQESEYEEAETLYRQALAIEKAVLPPKHPETTRTLRDLGRLLTERGDYAEAEPLLREVLSINRAILGDDHPRIATDLNNLAVLEVRRDRVAKAEPLFRKALQIRRERLGDDHPYVAISLNNLAHTLKEQDNIDAALPLYRDAVRIAEGALGTEHVNTSIFRFNLGTMHHRKGAFGTAETMYRASLDVLRDRLPADHPRLGTVLSKLGHLLVDTERPTDAEPLLREALSIREERLGADDEDTAQTRLWLGMCLAATGQFEEAEQHLRASHVALTRHLGTDHRYTQEAQRQLAALPGV